MTCQPFTYADYMAKKQVRWLDEREQRAWRGFHAMRAQLISHLGRQLQADSGISDADFEVLVAVSEAPRQRTRAVDLGQHLGWEKSRLSKQVSRMEVRGLVRREECATDSRSSDVVLTAEGKRVITAAAPAHLVEIRKSFIDLLTPEQLDTLAEISDIVVANLDKQQRESA